jgi:FlaG/FlaF family flagellin (archaellin)
MHLRRLLAATVATALVGPAALVAAGSPASAATATRIVGSDGKAWLTAGYRSQPGVPAYGDSLSLSVNVETTAGQQVYDGTITVQRQLPGRDWTTIKSASSAYLYETIKAVGNANYRVLYSGSGDYAPSTAALSSKVQRKLDITAQSGKRLGLEGKVAPKGKNKIVVLKKQGKKWKHFKSVRSNKKGRFFAKLPAPASRGAKLFWRLEINGSKAFAKTRSITYYTTKY